MSCDYCFEQDSAMHKKATMNFEIAKKAVNFLVKNSKESTLKIIFFGGEPLLEYELIKKIMTIKLIQQRSTLYLKRMHLVNDQKVEIAKTFC